MLISRVWLQSMLAEVDAHNELSDAALGDAITSLGLEVEDMRQLGAGLEKIVVGRVEQVEPHPGADKLRLVKLFDGDKIVPVVCGAPNVPAPGGNVAFAPVGTVLPDGLEIAPREIRGEPSEGMICAEAELEIGPDSDGIIVLPETWQPGQRLIDCVAGIVDTVYELGITPNRPDALGHVGVARDLAVKLKRTFVLVAPELEAAPALPGLVHNAAPDRCGRYIGRCFEQVTVARSPLWLRVRLHRLDLRPINNVVDITNLVLMMWGQPLHAFDRSKLAQGRIEVRRAAAGEPMTTLDAAEIKLDVDDLVIADAKRPVALAGVMGGLDSGVENGATQVVLEAAWFHPTAVRRSARRHGYNTDASYRFERGVDPAANLSAAAATAVSLLGELTGAKCVGGTEVTGELPAQISITLRPARTRLLLGMEIPEAEAKRVLAGLDIRTDASNPERWQCVPPSWRPDLQVEEDLIEELVRHYGLDRLPSLPCVATEPPGLSVSPAQRVAHERWELLERVGASLRAVGLHEHLSLAFTSAEKLEAFENETPRANAVTVTNPLRSQLGTMRTHLLPGLLDAMEVNLARHGRAVRLYELGRIYDWAEPVVHDPVTQKIDRLLPRERERAGVLICDPGTAKASGREISGLMLDVLARMGVTASLTTNDGATWLHPGVQAALVDADGARLGVLGEVHPDLLATWDLPKGTRAHYAQLHLEAVPRVVVARHTELPRFPATSRDLSLEVPTRLPADMIVAALYAAERSLPSTAHDDPPTLSAGDRGASAVEVVEDYRGEGVPEGHRALLLRLSYRARARSVTDTQVQERHDAVVSEACRQLQTHAPNIRAR